MRILTPFLFLLLPPLLALPLLTPPAHAQGGEMTIAINTSQLLQLPSPAATVVIGNTSIADVTLESDTQLLLHSQNPGVTNLIALNAVGEQIFAVDIRVVAQTKDFLYVHRGIATEAYDCVNVRCLPVTPAEVQRNVEEGLPSQLEDLLGGN